MSRPQLAARAVAVAYAAGTAVFIWVYLTTSLDKLCVGVDVQDPRCGDQASASTLLTAGRWVSWLAGAALAVLAVRMASWRAIAGTVAAGGVFSVLALTGPIAVP